MKKTNVRKSARNKKGRLVAKRTKPGVPEAHCCGADFPAWKMAERVDEYHIPMGTLITLSKVGRPPNDKYILTLRKPTGGNPCSQLKSIVMIPVVRKPPSEISAAELIKKVDGWKNDYLKACRDIISSNYNYKIGVGRIDHVPTLVLFIQSKYDGVPGHCRTFALVLKKLDEMNKEAHTLQGGVLHGTEN